MNLRRYTLFLLVAFLTFIVGVTAAVLVGKINPFSHKRYEVRSRGCRRLSALPAAPATKNRLTVYTAYRSNGTVYSYEVDETLGSR